MAKQLCFLVLIMALTASASRFPHHPPGGHHHNSGQTASAASSSQPQKSYQYVQGSFRFQSAVQQCTPIGKTIAVINSQSNNQQIGGLLTSDQSAWIGLNKTSGGQWTWSNGRLLGSTSYTFTAWASGQPQSYNNMDSCAYIQTNQWYSGSCNGFRGVVCQ